MSLRIRNTDELRFFIYISDAKVSMLYDQLAGATKTSVSIRSKLRLAIAEVERTRLTEPSETLFAKLDAAVVALRSQEQIGNIDEPGTYFEGEFPMRWGLYQDHGRPDGEAPLVYFGGETESTVLGLGGSARHVIGFSGATSTGSRSATPYLVAQLLDGLGADPTGWNSWRSSKEHSGVSEVFEAIAWANHNLKGPTQTLKFVAKTLAVGAARSNVTESGELKKCILGSPIFVEFARPSLPEDL